MAKKAPTPDVAPSTPTSPTPAEKLEAYTDAILSEEVPYERIAEMAGVTVEDVLAFIGSDPPGTEDPEGVPPLDGDAAGAEAERLTAEEAKALADLGLDDVRTVAEADLPEGAVVLDSYEVEDAPASVRVVAGRATVLGPDGRPWRLRRRDVYSGDNARFLWMHHQELVEPYPHDPG